MKCSSIPSHCRIAEAHIDRRMWVVLLITGLMATYVLWLFFGNTYLDTKFAAPAFWAIGLAFYMEGGEGNLRKAREQFNAYVVFFPSRREYDDLAEAARNNIAVIGVQFMQLNGSDKYAQTAVKSLKTFLDRWPDSPQAPAARLLPDEIQKTLGNQP